MELESIVDSSTHDPAVDQLAFPGMSPNLLWTSTPFADTVYSPNTLWVISFHDGSSWGFHPSDSANVLCVR
jgi:hypothetical protein